MNMQNSRSHTKTMTVRDLCLLTRGGGGGGGLPKKVKAAWMKSDHLAINVLCMCGMFPQVSYMKVN